MHRITLTVRTGKIFPTYLKSLTPICLLTQLLWFYDQLNPVIRQKSVLLCVKGHIADCACLLTVPQRVAGIFFFFFFFQEGANSEVEQYCTTVMGPGARRGSSDVKQQNKQSE